MERSDIHNEKEYFIQDMLMKFGKKDDYSRHLIGRGFTSSVFKISDDFCLKVSTKTNLTNIPENFKTCENICAPLETHISPSGKYAGHILEYLNLYGLQYLIKNNIMFSEEQVVCILHNILNGLKVIHENGYVHGDFHPGNVIFTEKNGGIFAKIIDFDDMKPMRPETRACFQYNGYQAPEIVFDNGTYDEKSEIFALGIISWELLSGKCFFGGYDFFGKVIEGSWSTYEKNSIFYNDRVKKALSTLPEYLERENKLSDACVDLLYSLLDFNRDARITAKEALKHPFIVQNLNHESLNEEKTSSSNKKILDVLIYKKRLERFRTN